MFNPSDPLSLSKSVEEEAAKVRRGWSERTRRDRGVVKEVSASFPRCRITYDPKDPEVMIGMEPV